MRKAQPTKAAARSREIHRCYPSWIAGLAYRSPQGIDRGRYARRLRYHEEVELRAEPRNRHSEHAVAIWHGACHLGYVPEDHDWVARAIDEGTALLARVVKVEMKGWIWRRVRNVKLEICVLI